ncbi:hypothetical protein KC360_g1763 [Hortaea werneckii]|nr:hypothetical protein KC325_g2436 [Hortaea werneckii]KAI6997498.1 hypothetical protein KC359_g2912 [Hortaea werneckii]KAI7148286.1 hypothetical protein KC344_g2063 [Hortaea werneckii]KAI7178161.1 hypothetical protein KC360_g1763 [Hortaea werneckii]
MSETSQQSGWLFYAVLSGGCAALNGVFAKLTTTQLTTTWATHVSRVFGLEEPSHVTDVLVRGLFFLLNLAFNAVMWGLFTRALTLATSTVRVSVINTSANFMVTAILGAMIFKESFPGTWWLGASFLVAGSVIIGRRDEAQKGSTSGKAGEVDGLHDVPLTASGVETSATDSIGTKRKS